MSERSPGMSAAVVHLPLGVIRWWEWAALGAVVIGFFWLSARGLFWPWASLSGRRQVALVIASVLGVAFLILMGYAMTRQLGARLRARRWVSSIGPLATGLDAAAVAGVAAKALAINGQGITRARVEMLERFEAASSQELPRIWIDAQIAGRLLRSGGEGRASWPLTDLCRDRIRRISPWIAILGAIPGTGVVAYAMTEGSWPDVEWLLIGVFPWLALAAMGILWIAWPKARLCVEPGDVCLESGGRKHVLSHANAFVLVASHQQTASKTSARWWFVLRGRWPVFCDDLGLPDLPWSREIVGAIRRDGTRAKVIPGECPACGHSTVGLATPICPECGGPAEPVQAGSR